MAYKRGFSENLSMTRTEIRSIIEKAASRQVVRDTPGERVTATCY
jgi:hypothetical protein